MLEPLRGGAHRKLLLIVCTLDYIQNQYPNTPGGVHKHKFLCQISLHLDGKNFATGQMKIKNHKKSPGPGHTGTVAGVVNQFSILWKKEMKWAIKRAFMSLASVGKWHRNLWIEKNFIRDQEKYKITFVNCHSGVSNCTKLAFKSTCRSYLCSICILNKTWVLKIPRKKR